VKKILLIICLILFMAVPAWSVDYGLGIQKLTEKGGVSTLSIEWAGESSASPVAGTKTGDVKFTTREINGLILGFETNPSATSSGNFSDKHTDATSGSVYVVPTDNYDIVLTNANGRNICYDTGSGDTPTADGILSNRDTSTTEYVPMQTSSGVPNPYPNRGPLTLYINAAGATNEGVLDILFIAD